MNKNNGILKKLQTEEFIWIICLIIIGLSFYANYIKKEYYMYKDISAKTKYRNLTIFIFLIALLIYIYFFNDSYNDVINLKVSDSYNKKFFSNANLTAATFILIAGVILLFIAIYDTELDSKIPFN